MIIKVDLEEVTWVCGDCNNRYDFTVHKCPNQRLDLWMIEASMREKNKDKKKKK